MEKVTILSNYNTMKPPQGIIHEFEPKTKEKMVIK